MKAAASGDGARPVVEVEGVSMSFGPISVLEGIDLSLMPGEKRALIGPNGAGKSTLFNLLSGRFRPTRGAIRLDGARIEGRAPHLLNRRGVSRSFQITHVFNGLSVRDNVEMAVMGRHGRRWSLLRLGADWAAVRRETDDLLEQAQLARLAGRQAGTLAYSDQRALEICMTVATGPRVILLDEPTAGMSREEAKATVSFIGRMTASRSLIMVEHDMDVVFGLADTISVLSHGRIIATGTPEAIRADARVQEAYLGAVPDTVPDAAPH